LQIAAFILAAILEIGGCYLMWLGQSRHNSLMTLAGIGLLAGFGWVLSQVDSGTASRTYAIYGGIYIATTLVWMVTIERATPDRWDVIGVAVTLAGSAIIFFGPRA
jgi:small multidrug resistance family-3 protein